jgi:hypothetical protein
MPKMKIRKAEIELCFDRFLIDAEDDFFPDPLKYKDLRHVQPEIVSEIRKSLIKIMTDNVKPIKYTAKRYYPWDVPKENYVIRQGWSLHPYDTIVFHFILNRLVSIIEPKLSKARYSYRIKKLHQKTCLAIILQRIGLLSRMI